MKRVFLLALLFLPRILDAQTKYQKDFLEFWNDINENYAYLKVQHIDWDRVKQIYEPRSAGIKTDDQFVAFLESILNELYNGHSSLNTNLSSSNRLVPSGQDIYVEKRNGKFIITDLRKNAGAERCGLKTGMEITRFNGGEIGPQLKKFLPSFTSQPNTEMYQYALNMLFAGTHDVKRQVTINENGVARAFYPDSVQAPEDTNLVETKILNASTAYIRINNCLYNNDLINRFDKFIDSVINFRNIVIDLSETPSGGNTTVARAMIGRFISSTKPYQRHEVDEPQFETKRLWTEYVVPRKKQFKGNVYVVVGHWTGSMGEGIAIGFDAAAGAKIVGTRMAGLLGAIENFRLSATGIGYQFPTEKLFHINGTPRENFVPEVLTRDSYETEQYIRKIK